MKTCSKDLREKVVAAYKSGQSGSYIETAKLFGIGVASLSRWLRLERETGSLEPRPRPGRPREMDLDWLRSHAEQYPDARLIDRVEAWEEHSGKRVHIDTISECLRTIGWTYKKNADGKRERTRRRKTETKSV